MRAKRAFFGTFWRGGLGAISRCLAIAEDLRDLGFSCYFFAEGVVERFVREAGFVPVHPPSVAPPKMGLRFPHISQQRVVDVGAVFSNLDEFYTMRGYHDEDYVDRAFESRLSAIESIDPDILFGYWSWETTIAARAMRKPVITIIQRCLHPDGGGFADVPTSTENMQSMHSFNKLLAKLSLPEIRAVEELMLGDVTLISGVPATDPLPSDPRVRYCGPMLWFTSHGKEQLERIRTDRKIAWVYGTDQDSWVGGHFLINEIVPSLAEMGFFVLVSSGGHPVPLVERPDVVCTGYVPGNIAAQKANLVVGRGGHDLFWTAVMARKPFFGAPPNSEWLDYCKCARSLGVGDYVEVDCFCRKEVVSRIETLVSSSEVVTQIRALRSEAKAYADRAPALGVIREFWPELVP